MIRIEVKEAPNNLKIISLEGSFDNFTINEAEKIINPLIERMGSTNLFLDLSKLDYINSTGIAKLLQCYKQLKSRNGILRLYGVSPFINEIMDLCGATKILKVYETQEEAMRSLK